MHKNLVAVFSHVWQNTVNVYKIVPDSVVNVSLCILGAPGDTYFSVLFVISAPVCVEFGSTPRSLTFLKVVYPSLCSFCA